MRRIKKVLKTGLIVILAAGVLALAGRALFRHFVTNSIMDGGGGMTNPDYDE